MSEEHVKRALRPYSSVPKDKTLDYTVIKEDIDKLLIATDNRIKYDWPSRLNKFGGLRELLEFFVPIAKNTFHTIRYFCAEEPEDPFRKLEYALSAGPLIRTIVDQVFALAFISESPSERVRLYYEAGWKEEQQMYLQFKKKYDQEKDWEPWFAHFKTVLEETQKSWRIPLEVANPDTKEPYWPIPSKMRKQSAGEIRLFLEHLDDWFYRDYSQITHLSLRGLSARGAPFATKDSVQREEMLKKNRSDAILTSITLILAVLSEIESLCGFGQSAKLQYLWTILSEYWSEAKEIYVVRYQKLLQGGNSRSNVKAK